MVAFAVPDNTYNTQYRVNYHSVTQKNCKEKPNIVMNNLWRSAAKSISSKGSKYTLHNLFKVAH